MGALYFKKKQAVAVTMEAGKQKSSPLSMSEAFSVSLSPSLSYPRLSQRLPLN